MVMENLIEMNARYIKPGYYGAAVLFMICSLVALILCLYSLYDMRKDKKDKSNWTVNHIVTVIALAALAFNTYVVFWTPSIKEIHYCANGPVSLEEISAVCDIVKVNGKEIIVRERKK